MLQFSGPPREGAAEMLEHSPPCPEHIALRQTFNTLLMERAVIVDEQAVDHLMKTQLELEDGLKAYRTMKANVYSEYPEETIKKMDHEISNQEEEVQRMRLQLRLADFRLGQMKGQRRQYQKRRESVSDERRKYELKVMEIRSYLNQFIVTNNMSGKQQQMRSMKEEEPE